MSAEVAYVGNHGVRVFAGDGPGVNANQPTLAGFPNVSQDQRKPYFVMPLLPGKSLDKLMKGSRSFLGPERAVEIIFQATRGLQAAHDQRVIHRDLKPSNLFVMSDDTVKIIVRAVRLLAVAASHDAGWPDAVDGIRGDAGVATAGRPLAARPFPPLGGAGASMKKERRLPWPGTGPWLQKTAFVRDRGGR